MLLSYQALNLISQNANKFSCQGSIPLSPPKEKENGK